MRKRSQNFPYSDKSAQNGGSKLFPWNGIARATVSTPHFNY